MKGLRIGITTPGATSDMFMRYLFRSATAWIPTTTWTSCRSAASARSCRRCEAGQVDGCSCLPPVDVADRAARTDRDVLDRLKDIPQLAGVTYGTLYGLASYNKAHPDVVNARWPAPSPGRRC